MNRPATAEEKRQQQENTTLNQGFVKDEDLAPEEQSTNVMTPAEIDTYAQKAGSANKNKSDELQGEGDYKAAESYNEAATDFARKQDDKKGERP